MHNIPRRITWGLLGIGIQAFPENAIIVKLSGSSNELGVEVFDYILNR